MKLQKLAVLAACIALALAVYALTVSPSVSAAVAGETIVVEGSAITRVYDGDTFYVKLDNVPKVFQTMGVRIRGIDTPEMHSACSSKEARDAEHQLAGAAQTLLRNQLKSASTVELVDVGRDKYFRLLAEVRVDGHNVADALLAQKLAVPYDGGRKVGWCKL